MPAPTADAQAPPTPIRIWARDARPISSRYLIHLVITRRCGWGCKRNEPPLLFGSSESPGGRWSHEDPASPRVSLVCERLTDRPKTLGGKIESSIGRNHMKAIESKGQKGAS